MQRRVENVFTTDKLKSNSKFYGGRLELFWWPFTFFVEKAIIAIVHFYSLVAMHFALAPLQFALTMNILGSVGGNLWSKPWKFMKSGWNIAPLRHMKTQRWEDRDTSFSKLLYETLPKALRTRSLTALTSNFGCLSLVWFGRFGLQILCTLHILHI